MIGCDTIARLAYGDDCIKPAAGPVHPNLAAARTKRRRRESNTQIAPLHNKGKQVAARPGHECDTEEVSHA